MIVCACVCMRTHLSLQVRPVTDELALSRLPELPLTELRPEFQAQARAMCACGVAIVFHCSTVNTDVIIVALVCSTAFTERVVLLPCMLAAQGL